jgi:alkylation response protein AidB-like acyl-CoA dehydrogenase
MDIGIPARLPFLGRLRGMVPGLQLLAQKTDSRGGYPEREMGILAEAGILAAPLPLRFGGFGLGVEPGRGPELLTLLHMLGQASLPAGRLVEAHINALRLIMSYGSFDLQRSVSKAVLGGAVLALWVTDPAEGALRFVRQGETLALTGQKQFCSGAGQATHAVVTAQSAEDGQPRLLFLDLGTGGRVSPLRSGLSGMRGAVTGQIDFTGVAARADCLIGIAGDYMKEPDFSAGAWRSSAVALGGLYAILDQLRGQLTARGRQQDPHQCARFGQALIAHQGGRLWLQEAGMMAEDLEAEASDIVATVGLARIAVERACLDGIELAQRSLGLGAFLTGNPVERMARDLATYLRQPAADEVLHNAAAHFMLKGLPTV